MRALFVGMLVSSLALSVQLPLKADDQGIAYGQVVPPLASPPEMREPINAPPPKNLGGGPQQRSGLMTRPEFGLSLVVVGFGLIVIFIEFWLLKRNTLRADEVLRVFALTLIIIGTLFFVTAGFDSNQIAPAMGLFGTIAGYLLGRRSRAEEQVSRVQTASRE